jgi:hypothetical protein
VSLCSERKVSQTKLVGSDKGEKSSNEVIFPKFRRRAVRPMEGKRASQMDLEFRKEVEKCSWASLC